MSLRTTGVLVLVLLILFGATSWVLVFGRPEIPLLLGDVPRSEIKTVDVAHGTESVGFEKLEAFQWKMVRPKEDVVDSFIVEGVTILLGEFESNNKLGEASENKAQYGLDPPEFRVELGLADGRKEVLLVGRLNPGGTAYYAMREGDPNVYLLTKFRGDALLDLFRSPPTDTPTPMPTTTPTPRATPTPYEFF